MNKIMFPVVGTLLIIPTLSKVVGEECVSREYIRWAPRLLKQSVFTSCFNHPHCPSWMTTNPFRGGTLGRSSLELVESLPFAFLCGACFLPSNLETYLTGTVDNEALLAFEPLMHNGTLEFPINDLVCLMSYGLTSPLFKSGKITCTLHRGNKVHYEILQYEVRNVSMIRYNEEVKFSGNEGVLNLSCPTPDSEDKMNITRVWYVDSQSSSKGPQYFKASMDEVVSVQKPATNSSVSCSTYNIMKPHKAWTKVYEMIKEDKSRNSEQILLTTNLGTDSSRSGNQTNITSTCTIFLVFIARQLWSSHCV